MATEFGAKELKKQGILKNLDESEEINACTVKIKCDVNGKDEDWLFLFKNETHNHPTEIEPFGGAATCIGGAIRDPLSGRSYVYQAMRVTGAGDPLKPVSETLPGKLPQRKLVTTAAAGYSSYGNQIGLATGQVDEIYHPGYVAKRMEIGAVVGATPASHVRRECPPPAMSSCCWAAAPAVMVWAVLPALPRPTSWTVSSTAALRSKRATLPLSAKLQRLFRREDACKMIKRCNDFGAGGVSVAIGELADGLAIDLNQVPKKYEGLDGTELAISESQERMAVVLAPEDVDKFIASPTKRTLRPPPVAKVTAEPPPEHGVERHVHCEHQPRVPELQRCREAPEGPCGKGHGLAAPVGGPDLQPEDEEHGGGSERLQQKGPFRALRLHHRCRDRTHALSAVPTSSPPERHGGKAACGRRDQHLLRHGMGLQPLPDERRPVQGRPSGRGGKRDQAGGHRLPL